MAMADSSSRGPRVVQAARLDLHDDLICGICNRFYDEPKKLQQCHHVYCNDCLIGLQMKSRDRRSFRCPKCRKFYSTEVSQLPNCEDLRRRAKQARDAARTSPKVCQEPNCDKRPAADCPAACPHCGKRLCKSHLKQHITEIQNSYWHTMNQLKLKQHALSCKKSEVTKQMQQVDASKKETARLFKRLHEMLNTKEAELMQNLAKNLEDLEENERECNRLQLEMKKLSELPVGTKEASDMWKEVQLAQQLIAASELKALPALPKDVRLEPDMQTIAASLIEKLRDLKVKCTDLSVKKSPEELKLVIRSADRHDFKPVQACLWTKTEGYCIDAHPEKRVECTLRARRVHEELNEEVLLVTNRQQLFVLSLEGKVLGLVLINDDPEKHIDWFSLSPCQKKLAVACRCEQVALVCDLSGRVQHRIDCTGSISTISLDDDQVIVTDAGVMENGQPATTVPGSVTIYSGEGYRNSRRIPPPAAQFDIYPTAAVAVRGRYFVLASNEPTQNSQPSILEFNSELGSNGEFALCDLECPGHMCADAEGRIYVSDHPAGVVSVFNTQGELIGRLRDFGATSCHGVSVNSAGARLRLVVCDTEGGRVYVVPLVT